jgi:hypothetical protein
MSDTSKKKPTADLTGIMEYAKKMQDSGQTPEAPKGSVMEEIPFEKIKDFESLNDYALANPAPDPLPEPAFDPLNEDPTTTPPESQISPEPSSEAFETTPSTETSHFDLEGVDLETPSAATGGGHDHLPGESGGSNAGGINLEPGGEPFSQSEFETSEFPTSGANNGEFGPINPDDTPNLQSGVEIDASTSSLAETEDFPILAGSESSGDPTKQATNEASPTRPPPKKIQPQASSEKLTFKKDSASQSDDTLGNVKRYSEQLPASKAAVAASFPFSILIRGQLRPEEKEKLVTLIEDHQMGFRLIDLEPQLASGRILIPRISEYAGILIIQALRGTRAEIKLGTSDSIFSTPDTHDSEEENFSSSVEESSTSYSSDLSHPAESIPVTPLDRLPGTPKLTLIDTVTANAALKSTVVEAEHSSAFQEIVEALQREIKYKAYRKGATAVLNFKIQINYLSSPTHYRILAFGSAVKPTAPNNTSEEETSRTDIIDTAHPVSSLDSKLDPKL